MSESKTFFCYLPDLPDAAERRAHIRPKHKAIADERRARGEIVLGGAILDNDGNMIGSGMVLKAKSEAAAWAVIKADHYWSSNVWDKEKILVKPIRVNGLPTAPAKL
ncbi:hypothetical protein CALCODRAFT_484664 [Calocera cornea HHB12733]|uniref:YCII-related domain-containing protein n=1 Tax=Calocera cornea HHB12733 TaxID=1353952 RepID=A0A165EUW0_9BASI|nr:hypothetical protein CALCODRAFT_484664 [Calocera cornea HHB12733]